MQHCTSISCMLLHHSLHRSPLRMLQLDIVVSGTIPADWSGDALVVGVFEEALAIEGEAFKAAELTALDKSLGGALRELVGTRHCAPPSAGNHGSVFSEA